MSRPEHWGHLTDYYNQNEATRYSRNPRIIKVQTELAERALELLALDTDSPRLILDLGVGSGLCASVLEDAGHCWVGLDLSLEMLKIARCRQQEVDGSYELGPGDLLLSSMKDGVSFRPGMFDGAISISALQWLFTVDDPAQLPRASLTRLFTTLYSALGLGARAVFQFYPESHVQISTLLELAMRAGFTGGLVIDYPNSTRKKKYFLCLITGSGSAVPRPRLDPPCKPRRVRDKSWVLKKKEQMRRRGHDSVPEDTRFTARKRKPRF